MTPSNCAQCVHWFPALGRSDANWGRCHLLVGGEHPLIHIANSSGGNEAQRKLMTRDVFFCAAFEKRIKPLILTDPTSRKEVKQ